LTYRTEHPRMRLAEFCGQTEYPAVCYLHYKLLLREQIARAAPHRQRPGICSPQSDRRQSRMRARSNEICLQLVVVTRSLQDRSRLPSSPPGSCRRGGGAELTTLWTSVRAFSSAAGVSGARLPVDAGGVAAQSEMPNRTSFSEVPAARALRFGDSRRTEAATLVGTKQESRSMSRSS
jgi:hypothetical protein